MASIDTGLLPTAAAHFQMASAPSEWDVNQIQQQKLALDTNKQNLEVEQHNYQKQKLTEAMRDVMRMNGPEDAYAAIDRHVANGDMTPEDANVAKSQVPPRAADGSLDPAVWDAYKQKNFDDFLATNEQLYTAQQQRRQQQQLQSILSGGGSNALAPKAQDDNALRQQITQLYALNTETGRQAANYLASQLKPTSFDEVKFGTYQPGDYTTSSWAKFVNSRNPGDLQLKPTATQEKLSVASSAPQIAAQTPKLKQGERYNATEDRVEQVPGSAEYIRQSKLHGNDYAALKAVKSKTELADKQVDRLLDPKNTSAFNGLFGGYNAYVTQHFTGKTADLKSDLDSLKQNLKSAGLELIKSGGGGAIGTITEREWPILEGMIESLSPTMSEDDARNKLAEIKAKMFSLRENAADTYETTWGGTQYYKGLSPTATTPAAGKTQKGATTSNW